MVALSQVFTLFLLLIVGYVVKKLGGVTERIHREISSLVLNVCLPASIITSMNFKFSPEVLAKSGILLLLSFIIYGVNIGISYGIIGLMKLKGSRRDIFQYVLVFSNVGYMGYPIAQALMGSQGVFYTAVYNLTFTILVWTFGVHVMGRTPNMEKGITGDVGWRVRIKRILNLNLMAVFIGFALFVFSVRLPGPIDNTLKMIGGCCTPLSMMFIGFILADLELKDVVNDFQIFAVSAVRLLVLPGIVWIGLHFTGIHGDIALLPVVSTAMPAAANTAIFAALYDNDYQLGSKIIFISTLLSIATIPLVILFMR